MIGWLDIVLAVILVTTLVIGLIKGLIREVVGIAAAVGGFLLAAYYYPWAAGLIGRVIHNETVAKFLGFLLIFCLIVLAGSVLAWLLSKLMKGPLKFINHFLGGIFGLIEGVLIGGAVVFALLVFPVDRDAVNGSRLAPYCYGLTKVLVGLIPEELKDAAKAAYQAIAGTEKSHGQKI
jgi:membrane protein required for colicin V production